MDKYFPASAQHEKAREFLELKQRTMIVLEYVAKFSELARFTNDYVATDMAKVRKFEKGLKLSIQGKIVHLLLQDLDSMVKTAMAMEKEWMTHEASKMWVLVIRERRVNSLLLAQERSRGLLLQEGFRDRATAIRAKPKISHPKIGDTLGLLASQGRGHVSIAINLDT